MTRDRSAPASARTRFAARIAREHAALRAHARLLQAQAAARTAATPGELAQGLLSLRTRLVRHFALEEAAALARSGVEAPRAGGRVFVEHRSLETRAARLQVALERCARREGEPRPALRRALLELLAELLRHERSEARARARPAARL